MRFKAKRVLIANVMWRVSKEWIILSRLHNKLIGGKALSTSGLKRALYFNLRGAIL